MTKVKLFSKENAGRSVGFGRRRVPFGLDGKVVDFEVTEEEVEAFRRLRWLVEDEDPRAGLEDPSAVDSLDKENLAEALNAEGKSGKHAKGNRSR